MISTLGAMWCCLMCWKRHHCCVYNIKKIMFLSNRFCMHRLWNSRKIIQLTLLLIHVNALQIEGLSGNLPLIVMCTCGGPSAHLTCAAAWGPTQSTVREASVSIVTSSCCLFSPEFNKPTDVHQRDAGSKKNFLQSLGKWQIRKPGTACKSPSVESFASGFHQMCCSY